MSDETRTPNANTVRSVFVRAHPFSASTSYEDRRAEFDRFIAKIKADAWDEGQEAGWNEAEECWAVEGMVGDFHKHSNVPNPYRIEGAIK